MSADRQLRQTSLENKKEEFCPGILRKVFKEEVKTSRIGSEHHFNSRNQRIVREAEKWLQ